MLSHPEQEAHVHIESQDHQISTDYKNHKFSSEINTIFL